MRQLIKCMTFMAIGATVGLTGAPQAAEACGGFFCDGGPQPMPVDQTGEDILFVLDGDEVEVHIRIEYDGEAEDFAWIIPVLSVPTEFKVGSQPLFDAVKQASVPTYGINNQADVCAGDDTDVADGGATGAPEDGSPGGAEGGPTVLAQEQVGAFEITVIGAGEGQEVTAQQVFDWLAENGYQQDESALPIIEEYLAEGHDFAALKLTGGADLDELHPIALRFDHPEACVPIRLTRIAAVDDMDIRTYFLADDRVVPDTYRHVLVNPLKIDWPSRASNYKEVITRAVDAQEANGRAFVTEYAGPSSVVSTASVYDTAWDAGAFEGLEPVNVISTLQSQGLFFCDYDWELDREVCFSNHALVEPLLIDFLVPQGVEPQDFYLDPYAYEDQIDLERWNGGVDFAQRLQERVIEPGVNAVELLEAHDYLTRMYTTISPSEMMADPMFFTNPDLGEVSNIRTATNRVLCSGDSVWTLPDGREVYVPAGASWPQIGGDDYWEEEVDQMSPAGAPIVLVDNSEAIDVALRSYNAEQGWDESSSSGEAEADGGEESSGCGCTAAPTGASSLWALIWGLGVFSRRRRQASRPGQAGARDGRRRPGPPPPSARARRSRERSGPRGRA